MCVNRLTQYGKSLGWEQYDEDSFGRTSTITPALQVERKPLMLPDEPFRGNDGSSLKLSPEPLAPIIKPEAASHTSSCVSCQQRKVACDRKKPCSCCIKVGTKCVYTARNASNLTFVAAGMTSNDLNTNQAKLPFRKPSKRQLKQEPEDSPLGLPLSSLTLTRPAEVSSLAGTKRKARDSDNFSDGNERHRSESPAICRKRKRSGTRWKATGLDGASTEDYKITEVKPSEIMMHLKNT